MPLKSRLIFELLFLDGSFVQSRNFRHQKVGNVDWLMTSYDLPHLAESVDEIFISDLSKNSRPTEGFKLAVSRIIENVRVPVALGGGVVSLEDAEQLLAMGADKVVVNTGFFEDPSKLSQVSRVHGKQFVVLSLDWTRDEFGRARIMKRGGQTPACLFEDVPWDTISGTFGEILLKSIDRDGTGNGLDLDSLDFIPRDVKLPIVLSGGIGKPEHIIQGLAEPRVSGVATANLLNFVGQSMGNARADAIGRGANLSSSSKPL
jgi:cyclase